MVIDDIAFTFIVFNVIYCACKIQPSIFFTTKAQTKKKEDVF